MAKAAPHAFASTLKPFKTASGRTGMKRWFLATLYPYPADSVHQVLARARSEKLDP